MPRYQIKFEDGSQEQIGAPGRDSDKIRKTVTAQAEKSKGKKVISIQPISGESKKQNKTSKPKASIKTKKVSKPKATTQKLASKKVAAPKGKKVVSKKITISNSTAKPKGKAPKASKVSKAPKVNSDNFASSIKTQISTLENTLGYAVQELTTQIQSLRSSILFAKKQELLSQLYDIDAQL
jgi:hypothetical protein